MTLNNTDIYTLERPHPNLKTYYIVSSFLWGPLFFIPLITNLIRYRTVRYSFDETGVTMKWGRLVRREISLRYARIQDIHLSSNIIERWLNLAKIELQTASAQSKAEMTIEGFLEFDAIRNFMYSKMHGADVEPPTQNGNSPPLEQDIILTQTDVQTLIAALHQVTETLRDVQARLEQLEEKNVPSSHEKTL